MCRRSAWRPSAMSADRAQALRSQSPLASLRSASSDRRGRTATNWPRFSSSRSRASTNVLSIGRRARLVDPLTPMESIIGDGAGPRDDPARIAPISHQPISHQPSPTCPEVWSRSWTPFRPPRYCAPDSLQKCACRHGQRYKPRSTIDQQEIIYLARLRWS
jgi:hypothetical protein